MNRLILFAHFDAEDQVKPYILFHLQALKALGGRIHFISNSPLPPSEIKKIEPLVERTLLRENKGLDFGMWKAGMAGLDLSSFDEVVLTNSSVVGPLCPLAPIFERMASTPCDFWAMTESLEHFRHLQTFFMVFRKRVASSSAFAQFFDSVLSYQSKLQVVHAYELGLTTFLRENGFQSAVAFPLTRQCSFFQNLAVRRTLFNHVRPRKNPTLKYPDLLLQAGMPYLKTMLFAQNPCGIRMKALLWLIRKTGFSLDLLK